MASNREFDIVLLGPTGYTGKLCAEHIVKSLTTNLKWALAGRSLQKVEGVAKELKALNPDRSEPEILAVQLTAEELGPLAQKTKLIINCIGPYHLYSTPVVEACAKNGTHYVDATGETPWVKSIIEKYHETAKSNGAILIPSVGVESAPADILTWSVVKRVREDLSTHTKEVTCAIEEMKTSGASGGTLNTILTIFDSLSFSDLIKWANPFDLAAGPPPKNLPSEPILAKLSGVRSVRDLGTLTTSPSGLADITIVHRSSTLMPEFYGPQFFFRQFIHVRNAFIGVLFHIGFLIGLGLLIIPPVRTLLRRYIYAPGNGPRMEDSVNDLVEYRAIATADQNVPAPKRVFGKLKYHGTMYVFTGLLLAEAAMVILENEEKVKKVSRSGIVTPATLGQEFVDRLDKVGCQIETKVFEY
ncbi:hypothetical protein ASPWEDRAFT_26988 [Aspergillus wentii DTO 134E9]|uniref:Saccharopine dehydrogenase NADP binding domain-containing protein n=1 Tax=Aspergillus wentii DTO 134E9 TaxID=1073089 RepID=A0A1L9RRQ5_ASPWE|nr:uncharacterized protein ASPWEDRAFT_26988 [Aspergillus wentii DTO 134E9]KAI9930462.1 hypothetical protein MW887_011216 [Aspergillus wentii]OJJ37621.1 hypothetical protein ASPWEDRAFT_26988 [Aspergillus wentii DTO 134E9]